MGNLGLGTRRLPKSRSGSLKQHSSFEYCFFATCLKATLSVSCAEEAWKEFLPGPLTSTRASMLSQKYPSNILQLSYFDWSSTMQGIMNLRKKIGWGLKVLCSSSISLIYRSCCPIMQSRALFLHYKDFGADLRPVQSRLMGEGQVNTVQLPCALPRLWKQTLVVSSFEENKKSIKKSNVSLISWGLELEMFYSTAMQFSFG